LFVLLPNSPELNGYVERAHLTIVFVNLWATPRLGIALSAIYKKGGDAPLRYWTRTGIGRSNQINGIISSDMAALS